MGTTSAIRIRGGIDMTIGMAIVDRVTLVAAAELVAELVVLAAPGGGRRTRAVMVLAGLVTLIGQDHVLVITTRRGAV